MGLFKIWKDHVTQYSNAYRKRTAYMVSQSRYVGYCGH